MPPKKTKEEEAARLAEEQKQKEEEEERQRKEEEKYKIKTLENTNLPLPITQYYIETAYPHQDPFKFTVEYLSKLTSLNNCSSQLRDIDIQIAAEELLNNLVFAKQQNGFTQIEIQILLNILFLTFTNNSTKYNETLKLNNNLEQKNVDNDCKIFTKLLQQHADEGYFRSQQIQSILNYFEHYLHHLELLKLSQKMDQRNLELHLDLYIEIPLTSPPLDEALIYRAFEQKEEDEKTITEVHEDQEVQEEPTDEELLDPIILEAISKKLEEAQLELDEKLRQRQQEMEEKVMSLIKKK